MRSSLAVTTGGMQQHREGFGGGTGHRQPTGGGLYYNEHRSFPSFRVLSSSTIQSNGGLLLGNTGSRRLISVLLGEVTAGEEDEDGT